MSLLAPLIVVIMYALDLFKWCVIGSIIFSWLVAFNVVNTRNRAVYLIGDFLYRVTEWALRPIRKVMPNTGALDLSPIVLFFILWIIQMYLAMLARGI